MDDFLRRLDEIKQQRSQQLEQERQALSRPQPAAAPPGPPQAQPAAPRGPLPAGTPALVKLGESISLREIDQAFIRFFELEQFYPAGRLDYETVFCETLEEFFSPIAEQFFLSPQARQAEVAQMAERARQTALDSGGGGIFGYNLPGLGCYLNGWLFVYGKNLPARAALQDEQLRARVLETTVHEKLGHGFLSLYSSLGKVTSSLGITQAQTAARFGLQAADDPTASLRREQAGLLYQVSQLLEEGWSTWLEGFMSQAWSGQRPQPSHSLSAVHQAVLELPFSLENRSDLIENLQAALALLFTDQAVEFEDLLQAVRVIDVLGARLDAYFGRALGQPLRYAVGELLYLQAEANLGTRCVPYAALIAGAVTLDPAAISLADLRELFSREARLNPDARLAAVSRLRLSTPGSVSELASQAASLLSLSIPEELKKDMHLNHLEGSSQ